MIYSKCKVCGCNITYKQSYCNEHKSKANDSYNLYNRTDKIRQARNTRRWKKLREEVIDSQKGLCLVSMIKGEYKPIDHIHHVTEANSDLSLFFDKDNLVGLSEEEHKYVHSNKIVGKEKFEKYIKNLIKENNFKYN